LLEGKTKECLDREEFISASPDIVKEILKRENLQIPEKQLLEHCCKWAKNQACFRYINFMQYFLLVFVGERNNLYILCVLSVAVHFIITTFPIY